MRALLIALLLSLSAVPALAQDVDKQAEAERLYNEGNTHFDLAEYDQAIASFKEAYRYVEEPLFLYNIAQAYRQKNDCVNARAFYKSYVRKVPKGDFATKAKKRIEEMEKCITAGGGDVSVEPPDPTDPKVEDPKVEDPKVEDPKVEDPKVEDPEVEDPEVVADAHPDPEMIHDYQRDERPGRLKRFVGIAGVGVGVILAATGGYFTTQARGADRDVEAACEDGCTADEVRGFDADGKAAERNATILYVSGGVAVAAGVGLYLWGRHEDHEQARPRVTIAPTSTGATILTRWSF